MVEKKAFQTHHRNISSVSDISVTVDPIKREDGAEIKIIFLLESDKERNVMFEVIQKSLLDGQSDIQGAVVLNHHWEQFHHDCSGAECVHCIRHPATTLTSDIGKKGHFRRGSADTDVIIQPQVTTDRDLCEKKFIHLSPPIFQISHPSFQCTADLLRPSN